MNTDTLRILVVDDEDMIRILVIDTIEAFLGITAIGFDDGNDVLGYLKHNPADIIISDCDMPNMHGLELLSKTKQLYPDIEFIMMSGHHSYAAEAKKKGAAIFMDKPVHMKDLIVNIRNFLPNED